MRKFLIALALLLTTVFLIGKFAEFQNIVATIQRGHWIFLVLALCVQGVWILGLGALYRTIYRIQGIVEAFVHMVRLSSAATFFNLIAPSGGMGGLLIFISDARRHGYSSGRATVSGALYVLFDYASLLIFIPLGFLFLFENNKLNWPEVFAAILLFLAGVGLTFLLYLGMRSVDRLGKVLTWLAQLANRVTSLVAHRKVLPDDRAYEFAQDIAEGIADLRRNRHSLLPALALAVGNKGLMIIVLALVALAFHVPFSMGIVVAGFCMAYLFVIMSPTPAGIGVVEGVLTISLHSMGISLDDAAVVTLVYRGFTLWVPFFVGLANFRSLMRRHEINGVAMQNRTKS